MSDLILTTHTKQEQTYVGPDAQAVIDQLWVITGIKYEVVSQKRLCTGMVKVTVKPK